MNMTAKTAFAMAAQAKLDLLPTNMTKKDYDELIKHIVNAAEQGEFYVAFNNNDALYWPGVYKLPYYMWAFDENYSHTVQVIKERQHLLRDALISLLEENGFTVESTNSRPIASILISWENV